MVTYYGTLLGEELYDADKRKEAITPPAEEKAASDSTTDTDEVVYCQFDGGFIFLDADWQEVKLGRVFLRSDCQIADNQGCGNRIVKSEYAASLGHFTEFTRKYELLIQEATLPGQSLVFITDGAVWMCNWMNENYTQATQILDFFHVCEHLGEFAKEVVSGLRKNDHLSSCLIAKA